MVTPGRMVFCTAALLMGLWAGSIRAATVTIDGSQTYQVIDGFGVNANHRSWNNDELKPVLDALIDQAGMTLFHVVFDNNNWEAVNDNSDPNVMNWAYYNSVYSSAEFEKLWGIMAYLNRRGITNGLVTSFEGPVALWLGGLSLYPGYENEYAETIASALVYARKTQHLKFGLVEPVNEPDLTYSGIHLSGPDQFVTVMHDLALQLDKNGLSDVRFSGPDLASADTSWLARMMSDPVVMAKLAHFGLHFYQNHNNDPTTEVYDFIQRSAYPDRHYWITEYNVWCADCQAGVRGDNSWAYARGTASYLLNLLANGASAGLVWEGYDSQYTDFDPGTGGNSTPHWSYWGLFAVDDINAAVKTYTPRKGFYTLAQIARFVRPGAQRIDASGLNTPSQVVAFYHTSSGQVTIAGVNPNTGPDTLSGVLSNLPPVGGFDLYYTDSTTDLRYGGTFPVTNSAFAATLPADCVFTLVGAAAQVAAPRGTFNGLFYPPSAVSVADCGSFTLNSTPKGNFSGNLRFASRRVGFSGRFDAQGRARVTAKLPGTSNGLALELQLDTTATNRLIGTVGDGSFQAGIYGNLAGKGPQAPATGKTHYTLALPVGANSSEAPGGWGALTGTMDRKGQVALAGTLGDGTRFSQSAITSPAGGYPLFSPLYGGKGLIIGWAQFASVAPSGAAISWLKPPGRGLYTNGFALTTALSGALYQAPARGGQAVVLNPNSQIILEGGDLSSSVTASIALANNRAVVANNSNKITLTFDPASGRFQGRFVPPGSRSSVPITGVAVQSQNSALGLFVGKSRTGSVRIE